MQALPLLVTAILMGCDDSGQHTLYRSSPGHPNARIHIATFDAADGDAYNGENCRLGAELFMAQPGVKTRFWCEKGRFRP
ncbi:hypothetical protein [Roseomonas indoligenes]|uniref:Uncharacterized protein n=1 Tax=Roseomonas indoligenes TaxID=2820811 RepID=A0A940N2I1_9PROT|nr:hypothetical protein [Pararoseomonas indoligenes]MBP0494000.1 hypothetical protein [Pararoseomonas indoligenes]